MNLINIIGVTLILLVFLPYLNSNHWFIKGQLYFRHWYLFAVIFLLLIIGLSPNTGSYISSSIGLLICVLICVSDVLPFTSIIKPSVREGISNKEISLKILSFNVYQENSNYQALVNVVFDKKPDLILLLEVDKAWYDGISELTDHYPYQVYSLRKNTYGILLLSRYPFVESNVLNLVYKHVPSVEATIKIGGHKIYLLAIHPLPPVPTESKSVRPKNLELEEAAKRINANTQTENKILIGDINDVPWSMATRKFKKATGLKDPRYGRGFFTSFPTYLPFGIPIDLAFCSDTFLVHGMRKVKHLGSDHFPIILELGLK